MIPTVRRILLASAIPLTGIIATGGQSASAATCAQPAHVYITDVQATSGQGLPLFKVERYETDPIDGPVINVQAPFSQGAWNMGGAGITPGQKPFWDFYPLPLFPGEKPSATVIGHTAGDNCVSNEVAVNKFAFQGVFLVRAFYYGGNSGATISNQQLVKITSP